MSQQFYYFLLKLSISATNEVHRICFMVVRNGMNIPKNTLNGYMCIPLSNGGWRKIEIGLDLR